MLADGIMATIAGGQPPTVADRLPIVDNIVCSEGRKSYADVLQQQETKQVPIPMKQLTYLHGEPRVVWEEEEVIQMIANEQLQYAVVGKFFYGSPDIHALRRLIPQQCDLKGAVNIGVLNNRYILIRVSRIEDYVHLLSKSVFYINHKNWNYPMRTLK